MQQLYECPKCEKILVCIGVDKDGWGDMQCWKCAKIFNDVWCTQMEKWFKIKIDEQKGSLSMRQCQIANNITFYEYLHLKKSTRMYLGLKLLY